MKEEVCPHGPLQGGGMAHLQGTGDRAEGPGQSMTQPSVAFLWEGMGEAGRYLSTFRIGEFE